MSCSGKCLYIDLTTGGHENKSTDKILLEEYIGGKGLGFALLETMAPNPKYGKESDNE